MRYYPVQHSHSSSPHLAGVSAQHPPPAHSSSGPNLLRRTGCAFAVLKDPAGSRRRDNSHLLPAGKVLDGQSHALGRRYRWHGDSVVLLS